MRFMIRCYRNEKLQQVNKRLQYLEYLLLFSQRVLALRNPVRTEGLASLYTTKATSSASVEQVSKARNVRQVGFEGHARREMRFPRSTRENPKSVSVKTALTNYM